MGPRSVKLCRVSRAPLAALCRGVTNDYALGRVHSEAGQGDKFWDTCLPCLVKLYAT